MGLFENPCFVDIDTQVDFVKSGGALYVEGAERLIPTWKKLTEFGEEHALPMIASADNHPPNDPEFAEFPPHCVQNTPGQRKIPETLCTDHQVIPNDPRETTIDFDNQIILFKQSYDVFTNVHADEVFGTVRCSAFVVYGVTTDYCIRCAVLGLLERGYRVHVVSDAIEAIDRGAGENALAEMANAGAGFIQSDSLITKILQHKENAMP